MRGLPVHAGGVPSRLRRTLCAALPAACIGCSREATPQAAPEPKKIGLLWTGSSQLETTRQVEALLRGLAKPGGAVVEVHTRSGLGAELDRQAAELLAKNVDVMVAFGTPAALAAQRANTAVPVAFAIASDPVDAGLVKTFAHPEGRLTGVHSSLNETSGKRVSLIHDAAPGARAIALLWTPEMTNQRELDEANGAAAALNLRALPLPVTAGGNLAARFAELRRAGVGMLTLLTAPPILSQLKQIADLALEHRMASIAGYAGYTDEGGLLSYGADVNETFRMLVQQASLLLAGAQPKDLPVQRARSFVLTINLKTAAALDLAIPQQLLMQAQRVLR